MSSLGSKSISWWLICYYLVITVYKPKQKQGSGRVKQGRKESQQKMALFSRQEHWSGLPFPSPMHESGKWKWSRSVVSDPQRPHGLQPSRLLCPWDFRGKSTRVGCHCLLGLLIIDLVTTKWNQGLDQWDWILSVILSGLWRWVLRVEIKCIYCFLSPTGQFFPVGS